MGNECLMMWTWLALITNTHSNIGIHSIEIGIFYFKNKFKRIKSKRFLLSDLFVFRLRLHTRNWLKKTTRDGSKTTRRYLDPFLLNHWKRFLSTHINTNTQTQILTESHSVQLWNVNFFFFFNTIHSLKKKNMCHPIAILD